MVFAVRHEFSTIIREEPRPAPTGKFLEQPCIPPLPQP
ncbi:hypothetical protein ROTMU0001_0891 [Rothia mucilaginosa ATCC 25296]|nr:hypothetical protein ROTMU0001_0891 [Rothia mucilaginosa ATCC 25296]